MSDKYVSNRRCCTRKNYPNSRCPRTVVSGKPFSVCERQQNSTPLEKASRDFCDVRGKYGMRTVEHRKILDVP